MNLSQPAERSLMSVVDVCGKRVWFRILRYAYLLEAKGIM